jgi:ankyrin repeat protein
MESLGKKSTIKAVQTALHDLPKDLDQTYEAVMQRIDNQDEDDKRIARSTLTWVTNAKRLLLVPELREALAIEPGAKTLDHDNLLDIEIFLSVCGGLVTVDESSLVVRLVHYTTQSYFDRIQASRFPNAQLEITSSLLTFLAFDDFKMVSKLNQRSYGRYALLDYSIEYSLVHASGGPETPLRDMILRFLEHAFQWRRFSGRRRRTPPWNAHFWRGGYSTLWVAAASNLLETVRYLLECGDNSQDKKALALYVAAEHGHPSIVQLLIKKGTDVKALGQEYGSALQIAALEGREEVVQFLIEKGADVNAAGGQFGSALQAASCKGHEAVVRLLVAHGADVNAQDDEYYGGALQTAAGHGHEDVVRFLIKSGADVNADGGSCGSALQAAAAKGCENIARFLIENGANVNAKGGAWGDALQAASIWGQEDTARLLVAKGADVNADGGSFGSALQSASWKGCENIARLLIENGANVNAKGGKWGGALQAASISGHEDIARLLVAKGADINGKGGEYDGALQAAAYRGNENLVRFLIEKGADVNMEGGRYGNALQAARAGGHEDHVRSFIEEENVKAKGGTYGGALQAASARRTAIVRLLLELGAKKPYSAKSSVTQASGRYPPEDRFS